MDEWHIGDPVDWGDGWMDAQNWGRRDSDDEDEEEDNTFDNTQPPSFSDPVHPGRLWLSSISTWLSRLRRTRTRSPAFPDGRSPICHR